MARSSCREAKKEGHPLVRMPFSAHATGSWAVLGRVWTARAARSDPCRSHAAARVEHPVGAMRLPCGNGTRRPQACGCDIECARRTGVRVRDGPSARPRMARWITARDDCHVRPPFRTGAGWSARFIWPRRLTANDEPIRTLRLVWPAVKRIHTGHGDILECRAIRRQQLADAWMVRTEFAGCAWHELRVHERPPQQIMQRDRGRTGDAPAPSVTHWRLRCRRSPHWLEYSASRRCRCCSSAQRRRPLARRCRRHRPNASPTTPTCKPRSGSSPRGSRGSCCIATCRAWPLASSPIRISSGRPDSDSPTPRRSWR